MLRFGKIKRLALGAVAALSATIGLDSFDSAFLAR